MDFYDKFRVYFQYLHIQVLLLTSTPGKNSGDRRKLRLDFVERN